MLPKLQYISQGANVTEHLINIQSVLEAGVKLVQLRLKKISEEQYTEAANRAKELCLLFDAQLIINDQPNVAQKSQADALHLGLDDLSVVEARKINPSFIIGGTANTFKHIQQRADEKIDYIGLGPFQFTSTKDKLSPVLGLVGYQNILRQMKDEGIKIPVYAIGGIELKDIKTLADIGIYGIAVSGLLTKSNQKENLVKEINKLLYHV